jgi:hypothetical protein
MEKTSFDPALQLAQEQKKVINSPASRTCARVDCLPNGSQSSSQSGYIDIPSSQTTGARARVREGGVAIRCREAYFRAWRIAKFGGDFDPIRRAVDEAVTAFSFEKSEAGRESDRSLWLKIGNRAGLSAFIDAFDQKTSEIEEMAREHKFLRNPASSFQKLLNKRFPNPEGGAA